MIVMGGIIGAGIFTNPYVVAQQVHTPLLILGAWAVGGLIALAGAFIYAELSSQVTASGGQYVYLRDAMHPLVAFLYGWSLLFVIQTGGMAAVALIFANHLFELIGARSSEFSAALLGSAALVLLTVINCIGVRAGSVTQNIFMILKLIAIATLVILGLLIASPAHNSTTTTISSTATTWQSLIAFGAARIAYVMEHGDLARAAESTARGRYEVPAALLSQRHIEFLLREEGFARLPRRLDDERPETLRPEPAAIADVRTLSLAPRSFRTRAGGLFLFVPHLLSLR